MAENNKRRKVRSESMVLDVMHVIIGIAVVVMAVISVVLLIVLLVTKKGNAKTKTPMGPALSIGAVFTVLLPLLSNVIGDAPFSVL